jgi:hypothetical protein
MFPASSGRTWREPATAAIQAERRQRSLAGISPMSRVNPRVERDAGYVQAVEPKRRPRIECGNDATHTREKYDSLNAVFAESRAMPRGAS